MKRLLLGVVLFTSKLFGSPLYFCTAADSKYFMHLLNLIGSIHHVNYSDLGEIAVFNLGMTQDQIDILNTIEKVTVHEIEKVHPDIIKPAPTLTEGRKLVPGWYAWKWVAIKQALDMYPSVLWIDAGSTVLKPLNELFKYIQQEGYFLCTIGMPGTKHSPVGWGTTQYVAELFDLYTAEREWVLKKDSAMGGIVGISAGYKDLFVEPMYKLAHELRAFVDDGTAVDGFGNARHDQTLLSVISYLKNLSVFTQDEKQQIPMELCDKQPFYITWDARYVCDKTHIYSSREDLRNFQTFYNYIRYKKEFISEHDVHRLDEFAQLAYSTKQTVYNSYILARECIKNNIPGDFVECGVAAGTQVAAMAYASQKYDAKKTLYLFDSFEGIPLASKYDAEQPGIGEIKHNTDVEQEKLLVTSGVTVWSLEAVTENMRRWKVNTEKLLVCKGWFEHTLPQVAGTINKISLLRLDGDLYNSTKVCLEYLYPKLSKGGYVIIDDYSLPGCKKAIDEYLEKHNLRPTIIPVKGGNGPVYWQVDQECMVSPSSYPYISCETYKAFCDHCVDRDENILKPELVNAGDTIYVQGDIVEYFFTAIHPHIKNKYILVTANSDSTFPKAFLRFLNDPQLSIWFGVNPDQAHPKFVPLPIGHPHKFCPSGSIKSINCYAQKPWKLYDDKKHLLYMNFKVCNNVAKRLPVQELFQKNGMCSQVESKPFDEFLSEMAQYKFVLSPEGAGPDCHRTWEAMLVGCIPIVLSSPLDPLFDDLPVLIINDWREVTPEFLEEKYQEMIKKSYKREKLYADYWLNKINTIKNECFIVH